MPCQGCRLAASSAQQVCVRMHACVRTCCYNTSGSSLASTWEGMGTRAGTVGTAVGICLVRTRAPCVRQLSHRAPAGQECPLAPGCPKAMQRRCNPCVCVCAQLSHRASLWHALPACSATIWRCLRVSAGLSNEASKEALDGGAPSLLPCINPLQQLAAEEAARQAGSVAPPLAGVCALRAPAPVLPFGLVCPQHKGVGAGLGLCLCHRACAP